MEERCFYEGISYTLIRKKVKNINLRVRADGTVSVSAGQHIPQEHIEHFLSKKMEYIEKNLGLFQEQDFWNRSQKQYISGESIRILGKDIRLKVVGCATKHEQSVFSDGVYLYVNCIDTKNRQSKESLVEQFLANERGKEFKEIGDSVFQKLRKYGATMPEIRVAEMKSRWGSCLSKKGIITLNTLLLEVPRPCIEYVILHEMCHLIHPNHSPDFYNFLTMFMPDWKEQKRILESFGQNIKE